MTTTLNASTAGAGGFIASGDNSGLLALQTAGTTAITVDASQNVGIGTTTPKVRLNGKILSINGTDSGVSYQAGIELLVNGASAGEMWANSNDFVIGSFSTQPMVFRTQNTERIRINSSGELLVGNTTNLEGGKFDVSASGRVAGFTTNSSSGSQDAINVANQANATYNAFRFWTGGVVDVGTLVGRINCTTSATSYVTSSDYRLKENIVPMVGALNKVLALKPVTYKWKSDGSNGQGFIAHELQEICPDAVVGTKDALNENGDPDYQGIDTSFLVATLTAALQETKALIDTQAETINALTARIVALETA
jgi:hypothetical protein